MAEKREARIREKKRYSFSIRKKLILLVTLLAVVTYTFSDKQMNNIEQTTRQSQEVAAIAEETSAGADEVTYAAHTQSDIIHEIGGISQTLQEQGEH